MKSFYHSTVSDFHLFGFSDSLLQAIKQSGYNTPTEIQNKAIPAILEGKDILASAQTGSGKTAAYALPILEQLIQYRENNKNADIRGNHIRVLVLVPSRALAIQVSAEFYRYSRAIEPKINIRSAFGGVETETQAKYLNYNTDILVATPQRILTLFEDKAVQFNYLQTIVFDEIDRLIEDNFKEGIEKLLKYLPNKRQNLMFSATFPDQIRSLVRQVLDQPLVIHIPQTTAEQIDQHLISTNTQMKSQLLVHLIQQYQWRPLLVFCTTKKSCDKLVLILSQANLNVATIHGNKPQAIREKNLMDFKQGQLNILIATDVAARGIDFRRLPCVINYELPRVPNDYLHRIGRTGRAGQSGLAISLISPQDEAHFKAIERQLNFKLEREQVDGFEANESIVETKNTPKKKTKVKKALSKKRKKQQIKKRKDKKAGIALAVSIKNPLISKKQ